MTTAAATDQHPPRRSAGLAAKGHVGLVVLASIAAGLALGLLLVLGVFAGGPEHEIIGACAACPRRRIRAARNRDRAGFTDQPQRVGARSRRGATAVVGLAFWALAPGDRTLDTRRLGLAGAARRARRLVRSAARAGRSHNWSRRALPLPGARHALLIAVGGAFQHRHQPRPRRTRRPRAATRISSTATASTSTASVPARRRSCSSTALANGRPAGHGCRRTCRRRRASARSTAPEKAGAAGTPLARTGISSPSDLHAFFARAHVPGPYVLAGHSVGGTYALVYAAQYPRAVRRSRADRLRDAVSVRPPGLPRLLHDGEGASSAHARTRPCRHGPVGAAGQFGCCLIVHAGRHERSTRRRASYGPTMPTSRNCRRSSTRRKRCEPPRQAARRPDRRCRRDNAAGPRHRTSSRSSRRTAPTAPSPARHTRHCSKTRASHRSRVARSRRSSCSPVKETADVARLDGDDDLAADATFSEVADRVRNIVERERPVDDRP